MDTAIRQSCIIFIYNGVPPTYDTSPRMLLVRIWPKTLWSFFVSAKFYWKTIWNTLAHFLAHWTWLIWMIYPILRFIAFSGALWFGTGRRLSSNYDTKIFWHIFVTEQKWENNQDLTEKFYFIAFSLQIAQKSRFDSGRKANGTLWLKSKQKNR